MPSSMFSRLAATAMSLCAATVLLASAHALLGHPASHPAGQPVSTSA